MHPDIIDLRAFYSSALGELVQRSISMALASLWAKMPNERLVGFGYAAPYLDRFRADTERTFAFMPAGQGAVAWPPMEKAATALVFGEELPLADSSVDRILVVHGLEHAEDPRETLVEMWRVLARTAGSSSSYPIGAASGRASSTRPSVAAGLTAGHN